MKIKIYLVDANGLDVGEMLASSFISPLDKERIERFKVETAKKEAVASAILKNRLVGEYHLNDRGKPVADGVYFNISHSKGIVVFAKNEAYPLGIDIERIREASSDLKEYVSSSEELSYIKDDRTFFEVWTNKEALLKARGTGINVKPNLVPGLPFDGQKEFQGKKYRTKTIIYRDCVICLALEADETFNLDLEVEEIAL